MNPCSNFAKNMEAIRRRANLTIAEFSSALGIPRSTVQGIIKSGQTSLDTALKIAWRLEVPLSTLTGEVVVEEGVGSMEALLNYFEWFRNLQINQDKIADHIHAILELLHEEAEYTASLTASAQDESNT